VSDGRDQWYVITGPPCCGKSTTIELLAQRGFRVRSEIARAYIDEELLRGRSIQEIRSNMRGFQGEILRRAIASEEALPADEMLFLDRAVPDSLAFFILHGISPEPYIERIRSAKYRRVFYLDPLECYTTDYARIESADEREQLGGLLLKAYSDFCIDRIPAIGALERIEYVLARVSDTR
jgi:predicted ATPase